MKLTESRVKQIIKEEMGRIHEEEMDAGNLEPEVIKIISKLSVEEQAVINQYVAFLKGNKQ